MIRLTREQVREIDRRTIKEFGIPGIELMENAALAVAAEAERLLAETGGKRILIVCGAGNNGGDGFAAARLLHERGLEVDLAYPDDAAKITGDAFANFARVPSGLRAAVATHAKIRRAKCDLIIDAILGTGATGAPRVATSELIDAINTRRLPVLAVDLPSGLDCDSGLPLGASCIRATRTVTFVAEKAGFANPESRQYTGEVIVADIGCPAHLIEEVAGPTG